MNFKKTLTALCTGFVAVAMISSCSNSAKQEAAADETAVEETAVAEEAVEPTVAVIELKKDETIAPADGKIVVIDFNATWCGPCKKFAPNFEQVAAANTDKAVFYSVDIDVHPELATKYGATSIPMVAFVKADGNFTTATGYMTAEEFAAKLAENL